MLEIKKDGKWREAAKSPLILDGHSAHFRVEGWDQSRGMITMECWPRYADPNAPSTGGQYPGWPKTISMEENYGRKAAAYLPTIEVAGVPRPVIQVIDESKGEIVYTIRARTNTWRPKVFAKGTYTIRAGDPDHGKMATKKGVASVPEDSEERLEIPAPPKNP